MAPPSPHKSVHGGCVSPVLRVLRVLRDSHNHTRMTCHILPRRLSHSGNVSHSATPMLRRTTRNPLIYKGNLCWHGGCIIPAMPSGIGCHLPRTGEVVAVYIRKRLWACPPSCIGQLEGHRTKQADREPLMHSSHIRARREQTIWQVARETMQGLTCRPHQNTA